MTNVSHSAPSLELTFRLGAGFMAVSVMLSGCSAPPVTSSPGNGAGQDPAWCQVDLEQLLRRDFTRFGDVVERADEYRLKMELAIPVPDGDGQRLVRSSVDFGPDYFYPASSVKTCAVLAALEQLKRGEQFSGADLGLQTPMVFQPLFGGEHVEDKDPSHVARGTITVGHDLRKVFLVSDNAAYNRLYELSGPRLIGEVLTGAGFPSARIVHRLSEFRSRTDQLRLPELEFRSGGDVLWSLPERYDALDVDNHGLTGISFGTAHTRGDEIVQGPMSFLHKNWMPLDELIDMNIAILAPEIAMKGRKGFDLSGPDRRAIALAMAQSPGESEDPVYDPESYPYEYSKFLAPGVLRLRSKDQITVRDKIGRAYGFSVTNSEVVDHVSGRRFFLAATIYLNPNGVVGDGVYDYDRADRFFADLGEAVAAEVFRPADGWPEDKRAPGK